MSNDPKDQTPDLSKLFDSYAEGQEAYLESLRKWKEEHEDKNRRGRSN